MPATHRFGALGLRKMPGLDFKGDVLKAGIAMGIVTVDENPRVIAGEWGRSWFWQQKGA